MNLGLAALDSPLEIVFRPQREICFLCLSQSCHVRSLREFIRVRDFITCGHLMFAFPLGMT